MPIIFHFKPAELTLWSAACCIFGWLVKSHFSSGSLLLKQNFHTTISDIRDRFTMVRDDSLVDAHAQSLPRVREACAKVRNHLGAREWEALNGALTAYSGLTKNDIENRNPALKPGSGPNEPPPPNYALGRTRLSDLLNEMLRQVD